MDYDQNVREMLTHLEANFSEEDYGRVLKALGMGIAAMMSRIENHELMHKLIQEFFGAIEMQACDLHTQLHPEQEEVDAETFLRDHFQPTKTND